MPGELQLYTSDSAMSTCNARNHGIMEQTWVQSRKTLVPSTQKAEAGGLWVWSQLGLHSKFQTNLGSIARYCLKIIRITPPPPQNVPGDDGKVEMWKETGSNPHLFIPQKSPMVSPYFTDKGTNCKLRSSSGTKTCVLPAIHCPYCGPHWVPGLL
jgi:hypothetical protein